MRTAPRYVLITPFLGGLSMMKVSNLSHHCTCQPEIPTCRPSLVSTFVMQPLGILGRIDIRVALHECLADLDCFVRAHKNPVLAHQIHQARPLQAVQRVRVWVRQNQLQSQPGQLISSLPLQRNHIHDSNHPGSRFALKTSLPSPDGTSMEGAPALADWVAQKRSCRRGIAAHPDAPLVQVAVQLPQDERRGHIHRQHGAEVQHEELQAVRGHAPLLLVCHLLVHQPQRLRLEVARVGEVHGSIDAPDEDAVRGGCLRVLLGAAVYGGAGNATQNGCQGRDGRERMSVQAAGVVRADS
jgi:hypothetical protein